MPKLNIMRVIGDCERAFPDFYWNISQQSYGKEKETAYTAQLRSKKNYNEYVADSGPTPASALNKCLRVLKLKYKMNEEYKDEEVSE